MYSLFSILHVAVSVILIVIVLMQSKQSMNLSGMFGGASQSALGSQPQSVLSKTTTVLAIVFMASSLIFTLYPAGDDGALSPSNIEGGQAPPPAQQQGTPNRSQSQSDGGPNQTNQSPRQSPTPQQ